MKRLLVGCECSGIVRDAFAAIGWDAWSCDLLPCERPGQHLQCDVLTVLDRDWDMFIVFPDCTFLCASGMHWTTRGLRDPILTVNALIFVNRLMESPVKRFCLENPVGRINTAVRKPDQYVQPYNYGHDASKKTGLWLKGLPELQPTRFIPPRMVCPCENVFEHVGEWLTLPQTCPICDGLKAKPRWANQTDSGQNRLGPSDDRWMERARTYEGIATAMAHQWGGLE
jgi:hypothetical protein